MMKKSLGEGANILRTMAVAVSFAGSPEEKKRTHKVLLVGLFLSAVLFLIGTSLYSQAQAVERVKVLHRVAFCLQNGSVGTCPTLLHSIHFEQGEK